MTKIGPNGDLQEGGTPGGQSLSGKSDVLVKISLVITSLTLILIIVTSAFPDWLTYNLYIAPYGIYNFIRIGIFYACDDIDDCDGDTEPDEWQKTAAGLHGTGMFLVLLAVVSLVIQLFKPKHSLAKHVPYASAICCLLSSVFILAAAIMLYTNREEVPGVPLPFDFDWALILSTVNGCILTCTGTLLSVHICM